MENTMSREIRLCWQWLLLSTLLLGLPGTLWAEDSNVHQETIPLRSLIQEALQHNPELVTKQAQVDAMVERIPQSNSLDDPELTIRLWNTPNSLDVTRSDRTIYGLAQQFPFPGTLSRQESIAEKVAEQAGQRLAGKKREIIAAVKVAYHEWLYVYQALEIHHQEAMRLKQFFEAAKAKFRVGKGTQVDVLKAQVEQSKWFQHLPVLEQQKETAQAHLNTILNREPQAPLGAPVQSVREPMTFSLKPLQEQALQQRPEVREATLAVEQQNSAIKLAELQTYPHLRVEVQRWQNRKANDGFGGIVSINLPFAFWTKPKYEAGVREAIAQKQVARFKKRAVENQTRFQVQDLIAQLTAKQTILTLYTTTVLPQAKLTVKAAVAGYRTDRTDFLDMISADRALLAYQLEYVRTAADWEQLLAKLEQVIGAEL
jgi:cobalt-zinc-cadmium efflux system outer membrane protein